MRKNMKGWCSFGFAVACLVLASVSAKGTVVLDQSYDPGSHITVSAGLGSNPNQERAQTFKVGVSGILTRVDVLMNVFNPISGSLTMDIRGTLPSGLPDPSITPAGVLSTATLPATSFLTGGGGFVTYNLQTPLPVIAGQLLAIDLHASAGASSFNWLGDQNTSYVVGTNYERETTNHGWVNEGSWDLGFRTFVDTGGQVSAVPLPPGFLAGLAGGLVVLVRRRYIVRQHV